MPPSSESGKRSRPSLAYQPGLDGLRALCLVAVLLFHSDFGWMRGGFLGVSTFFTLSGFLIASLLLEEWGSTGSVSFAGFWRRRLRRLMPASLLGIAAVVLSSPWWIDDELRDRMTGDALAALVYAVNWRFVQEDYAYEAIFVSASPLQHFWSLAIEAQFYLFFPFVVGALLRFGSGTRALAAGLSTLAVASIAIAFAIPLTDEGETRIYYGSDTRFAEILFGALLALALRSWPLGSSERRARVVQWTAPAALGALVVCWVSVGVTEDGLYRGGFAVYALASTLVVAGAVAPSGPVRALLSIEPLPWLGALSYGAYVYHWPLFLILTPERTGLGPVGLLGLRLLATLVTAAFSYRFIEEPIRRRRGKVGAVAGRLLLPSMAGVAAVALWLSPTFAARSWTTWFAPSTDEVAVDGGARVLRVGLYGDSTAFSLAHGLRQWAGAHAPVDLVTNQTRFGCGLVESGQRNVAGRWAPMKKKCKGLPELWRSTVQEHDVDVAVVLTGTWDTRSWRSSPDAAAITFGAPEFDPLVRAALAEGMDALVEGGASVLWLTVPHLGIPPRTKVKREGAQEALEAAADPVRVDQLNRLSREQADLRPGVRIVDLGDFVARWPGGEFDLELRRDHIHFSEAGSVHVADELVGPELLRMQR